MDDKGVYTFPKGISLKMNMHSPNEVQTYYNVVVQHLPWRPLQHKDN